MMSREPPIGAGELGSGAVDAPGGGKPSGGMLVAGGGGKAERATVGDNQKVWLCEIHPLAFKKDDDDDGLSSAVAEIQSGGAANLKVVAALRQ